MELAPCGMDCAACPQKPENCDGCHAESDHLWSGDCRIRVCCKFEKHLSNCSLCADFPCPTILEFESDKWDHHKVAVQTLRGLQEKA